MPGAKSSATRRGRLPTDERERRRVAVIEAAFQELIEHGAEQVTMLSIAKRAGASKETLYSWFGSRDGLFSAMITHNAAATSERIEQALSTEADPHETLAAFGLGLLRLLTNERSLALNRAAMANATLSTELLASGRHRVGPIVERYLADLDRRGVLAVPDPSQGFEVLYGLVIRDTQIRVLLGDAAPNDAAMRRRAEAAVGQFFDLAERGRLS